MSTRKDIELTEREMRRLLDELKQEEEIVPVSEEEAAEIEAAYRLRGFPTERDERQRRHLEEMWKEWASQTEELEGLFRQAQKQGLSQKQFAQQLQLGLDVLLKLDLRILKGRIPHQVHRNIAEMLSVTLQSIYRYLNQPSDELAQMAASSDKIPAASRRETWEEAVSASNLMSEEEKQYWLNVR